MECKGSCSASRMPSYSLARCTRNFRSFLCRRSCWASPTSDRPTGHTGSPSPSHVCPNAPLRALRIPPRRSLSRCSQRCRTCCSPAFRRCRRRSSRPYSPHYTTPTTSVFMASRRSNGSPASSCSRHARPLKLLCWLSMPCISSCQWCCSHCSTPGTQPRQQMCTCGNSRRHRSRFYPATPRLGASCLAPFSSCGKSAPSPAAWRTRGSTWRCRMKSTLSPAYRNVILLCLRC
mmetsp:Transcript_989/g.2283  ORF Transcript_989/g.2283 Transcript_989/m.2283 type:complete len:233 (-) Transcript_989:1259-1957(-)